MNEIRRAHPALQRFENLAWLETHSDDLIAYAKQWGDDTIITVVNLDPENDARACASCRRRSGCRRPSLRRIS